MRRRCSGNGTQGILYGAYPRTEAVRECHTTRVRSTSSHGTRDTARLFLLLTYKYVCIVQIRTHAFINPKTQYSFGKYS